MEAIEIKVFYHNDLDGRAAGAVVNLFREAQAIEACEFIEMEYSKDLPLDIIRPGERIYIVDYHIQNKQQFFQLCSLTQKITMIDHHKSTVEERQEHPDLYDSIETIIDEGHSGCWLTWEYFAKIELMADYFDDNAIVAFPGCIKLIDDMMDRGVWQYDDKTANFCEGIKLYPHQPTDTIWKDLLILDKSDDRIIDIIADGKICIQYANMICKDYVSNYGFETEFAGYKSFAQGLYKYGSKAFGERLKQYPLCLSFEFTGEKWIIGLYSETIDVSKIAVKYGGGGHKSAAGFICDELPFRKTASTNFKEN